MSDLRNGLLFYSIFYRPRDGEKKVHYALVRRGRERTGGGGGNDTQCSKLAIIV